MISHGTTLGTNAVINREMGKVGLLITKGHEDVPLIMRAGARTDGLSEAQIRHQAVCRKPAPLVPRPLIKGVIERVDCFSEIVTPLDKKQARSCIDELIEEGVEAIAISLLWSFANSKHEKELKEMIENAYPQIYIAASYEIAPQIREYARTMTVIIDAAIGTLMKSYIDSLNHEFMKRGLKKHISIMHAYGGVTSSSTARPVSTIESGPVGGVIGGKYLAEQLGYKDVITSDVGGTSFDVSVLKDGEWSFAKEPVMMRFRVAIPIIKITCIGAGGGTICQIDQATGRLKVGPESAGSNPGPVCYGLGGEDPTVTDADLILGYLNPDYFFEGRMKLDKEKAFKALKEKIADPLGMDVVEASSGIYDIINSYMADNLRQSVIEKGYDPRDFVLFAYGGNGPMHVGSFASELGIKKAFIPPQASVFSAFGIASSDVTHMYKRSELFPMPVKPEVVNQIFADMEKRALEDMEREGFDEEKVILKREVDLRYARQVHEVGVLVKGGELNSDDIENIIAEWEKNYEAIYGKGSAFKEAGVQLVSFRITAVAFTVKPVLKRDEKMASSDPKKAFKGLRKAFFAGENNFIETPIYDFTRLSYGNMLEGPAIVEAPTTTVIILPQQLVKMDEYHNIVFEKF